MVIFEAKIAPPDWQWMPPPPFAERAFGRIAARCDERDRDVLVRVKAGGKLEFEAPLGLLHDAYDGRGIGNTTNAASKTEAIVGHFGEVIARLNTILQRMDNTLPHMLTEEKVSALGTVMSSLQTALAQLGQTPASCGLSLTSKILVSRHDNLTIEVSDKIQAPVRVYLHGVERF